MRFRARWGCACRWRSEGGWCPCQWTHSAVAISTASMSCQCPWPKDEFGLVQGVERLGQSIVVRGPLSSPGFCGGWFTWMWSWLVVVVPGGGRRVPRRLRARRGCACRWRSEGGWCPCQWTDSAAASSTASMSCQCPWPKDELGLVQRVECLSQRAAERSLPGAHRGDCLAVGQSGLVADGSVLHPTVASGAPGQRDQPRCFYAARRPFSGRLGPGRCTLAGRWSASR